MCSLISIGNLFKTLNWFEGLWFTKKTTLKMVQSNLDYPDPDYPDYSIIQTIRLSGLSSLVPVIPWILISCDLENSKSQKAQ